MDHIYVRCGGANVLVQFVGVGEHDKGDLSITKNSEFLGFLENAISSLRVGDLPVCGVFNLLNLNFSTTHVFLAYFLCDNSNS